MMTTLTTFFDWLVTASLRASALTLAVWIVQFTLQKHLSPRWRYALWLPVLVVLLMPVLPESRWSLESVLREKPQVVEVAPAPMTLPLVQDDVPLISAAPQTVRTPIDWQQISQLTWASGAALLLLIGAFSFMRALRLFQRTRQSVSTETLAQLEQVSREVGLRQAPRLLVAPTINSPAVTGLLRPVLLLPAGFERDFSVEEARLILQHELTHLKRHDLPLNTLLCVLMALHWFNPLLWLAFFMARADREAACDAQVLENATPQRRSEYGHALLKIEASFAPLRLSLGFIGILQRRAALRARIRSIATPTRTRPLTGFLTMLSIACMIFLGVTRAEKPAPNEFTHEESKLIAIEITTVHFKQDTTWDFDGRFKQLAPEATGADAGGKIELLGEEGVRTTKEQLQKQAGVDLISYPRMVTADGKEVMVRSVVNQPVQGGKNDKGEALITYLPIGFVGKFIPKTLPADKVALNIDLTDSHIIATETIRGSEYPVASSRVYRGPVELEPGITVAHYTWQGYGWKNGKPVSYRPAVTFITTHVIDPKAGGLPASTPSDVPTGKSTFRSGDSIRITNVQRGEGILTVTADYELSSEPEARISLHITSTKGSGWSRTAASQSKMISKGKGSVTLHHPNVTEGLPHVSFYPVNGGSSFGGIYFGTQAEVDASQKMSSARVATSESKPSGSTKAPDTNNAVTLNFPDAPIETVTTIYAKLKGQTVSVEPEAKGSRVKIVATHPLSPQDATAFIEAAFLLNGFVFVADGPDKLRLRKTDTSQPSVIETKLQSIKFPTLNFPNAAVSDIIDYLRTKSRELDTQTPDPAQRGVNILHRADPSAGNVTINLSLKDVTLGAALQHVAKLAGLEMKITPYAVILGAASSASVKSAASRQTVANPAGEALGGKIILPSVQFREILLKDAIAFIRHASSQHDPGKKGVNISIKGDGGTSKITLDLKDVPVFEALRYCAELAGHQLSIVEDTFLLAPAATNAEASSKPLKTTDSVPGADAEARAAELRRAKPQQYDFAKARLGDVLRFIATDAGISFISLPEDHPANNKLVTFSMKASPFEVLEALCRTNGLVLLLDKDLWYIRPSDDQSLIGKAYEIPKTAPKADVILQDIRSLLNLPDEKTEPEKQDKAESPRVTFKEAENSVYAVATRQQHAWIEAYFKGLSR